MTRGHDLTRVPVQRSCGCASKEDSPLTPDAIFRMGARGPVAEIPHRTAMETAFGQSFVDVRAYLGRSEPLSLLGGSAATQGKQVIFRDTSPSKEVVGHELAHVVQNQRTGSSGPALSHPADASEIEASRVGRHVARGGVASVGLGGGSGIALQRDDEARSSEENASIPSDVDAEIARIKARGEPSEEDLRRLGRLAVARMGARGVAAAARRSQVPGAERRQREVREKTVQRQSPGEAAAATAGTMWWLTLVDGPLPVGDIIYGALILGAAAAAALTVDTALRTLCAARLEDCLENPSQPSWNRGDFGPRKDCGACYRECMHSRIWPEYKCPST